MATILVVGGAGYVGSHCCFALTQAEHKVERARRPTRHIDAIIADA